MAVKGKPKLPLFSDLLPSRRAHAEAGAPLRVDVARRRLGGRGSTLASAGSIVSLDAGPGIHAVGVVLYASAAEIDVWIDEGVVRRMRPELAVPFPGTVAEDLLKIASDARLFATLAEGDRVRFLNRSRGESLPEEGELAEKCRYGALVLRSTGSIVAVGFRNVWPLHSAAALS